MSEPVTPLIKILGSFNRKERNLLFRDVMGCSATPPPLSADFLDRLNNAIQEARGTQGTLKPDAWWSTDFHFDWLFAAVLLLRGTVKPDQPFQEKGGVFTATQEDIDLVVANNTNLILVEAKAYGAHSNNQVAAKRLRFNKLVSMLEGTGITADLMLTSPRRPQKLRQQVREKPLAWLELKIDTSNPVYGVMRSDEAGNPAREGGFWTIPDLRKRPEIESWES
jgi:hypothetical protein